MFTVLQKTFWNDLSNVLHIFISRLVQRQVFSLLRVLISCIFRCFFGLKYHDLSSNKPPVYTCMLCVLIVYSTSIDTLNSLSYSEIVGDDTDSLIKSWNEHEWSEGRGLYTPLTHRGVEVVSDESLCVCTFLTPFLTLKSQQRNWLLFKTGWLFFCCFFDIPMHITDNQPMLECNLKKWCIMGRPLTLPHFVWLCLSLLTASCLSLFTVFNLLHVLTAETHTSFLYHRSLDSLLKNGEIFHAEMLHHTIVCGLIIVSAL